MINTLHALAKFLPYRKLSPDTSHHLVKESENADVPILLHKLDLCRPLFKTKLPIDVPSSP